MFKTFFVISSVLLCSYVCFLNSDLHQKKEETTAAAETVVKPPDETEVTESASQKRLQSRADSAVWTGINQVKHVRLKCCAQVLPCLALLFYPRLSLWLQVPDRFCVSAPSSDRSRSYIHPKTSHVIDRRSASGLETRVKLTEIKNKHRCFTWWKKLTFFSPELSLRGHRQLGALLCPQTGALWLAALLSEGSGGSSVRLGPFLQWDSQSAADHTTVSKTESSTEATYVLSPPQHVFWWGGRRPGEQTLMFPLH